MLFRFTGKTKRDKAPAIPEKLWTPYKEVILAQYEYGFAHVKDYMKVTYGFEAKYVRFATVRCPTDSLQR